MYLTRNGSSISAIGFGGASIGSNKNTVFFNKAMTDATAIELVHHALDSGINLIDTSPFYGDSERKIGLALSEWNGTRESLSLCSKMGTNPNLKGYTYDILSQSIEESLKTLHTDYLDVIHIHDPAPEDLTTALTSLEQLVRYKEQGVVRHIGLGVRDQQLHHRFINSGFADAILTYFDYNVLNQSATQLIDKASDHNTIVFNGSAVCMGLLSGQNPKELQVNHYNVHQEKLTEFSL